MQLTSDFIGLNMDACVIEWLQKVENSFQQSSCRAQSIITSSTAIDKQP